MVNGRAGDHPLTDILDHGVEVFSPEVDDLIRRLAKLVPGYRLFEMFDWFNLSALPEFKSQLEAEIIRLSEEARASGWEIE